MKTKNPFKHSLNGTLILQFILLILATQILLTPLSPQQVTASPLKYGDTEWEDPPGAATDNDAWGRAYPLGNESVLNNNPLVVNSSNPDYYAFNVTSGSYFSVSITFNQSNAWNESAPYNYINLTDPLHNTSIPFYADLDIYLWAQNGTDPYMLGYSNYSGYEEAIGPFLINASDTLIFNVTCTNMSGYEWIQYSTTYNMSVVFEDKWELLYPNDNFEDLTPPDVLGGSDDEIIPGHYEYLRLSSNANTSFRDKDTYWILLYEGSWVNITVSSYNINYDTEGNGPHIYLYYPNQSIADFQKESDGGNHIESLITTISLTSWYYLRIDNEVGNTHYYTLDISLEDAYEIESGNNHDHDSATEIKNFGRLPGMVVSKDNHDWFRVDIEKFQRLRVDINWYPVKIHDGTKLDLNLTVYENDSLTSESDDPLVILNGLRFGPHRVLTDSTYFVHVSSNNLYPLYYNLTIAILGADDWAEENDLFNFAYLLPTQSKEYKPTETNPDAGLISLEGDMDWFAINLLPGDWITVRIDFNGTKADLNMLFADAAGNTLDTSALSGSDSETISYRVSKSDVYLLLVLGVGPSGYGFAKYNMTVDIDLFDDVLELPNNDFGAAAPIAEGNYTNLILRDDLYDYYYIYLSQDDTINISLEYFPEEYEEGGDTLVNDIDLELYADYTGTEYPRVAESITVLNESISYTASVSGQYFILCIIWGGETPNSYNLTIDIKETDDAHEDNDNLGDATRITVVEGPTRDTVSHIETAQIRVKDDDYFVVNVPAGLAIIVEISQFGSENLDLELLSLNGSIIDSSTNDAGYPEQTGPFPINSTYSNLYNGTDIYFRVFMDSGLSTSYSLNVTIGPEDVLIPQETVPPFSKSKTKLKPFNPLTVLIPLAVGGAILGGGAAGGIYAAKKTGALDKGVKKLKDLRKRPPKKPGGGATGGLKKPGESGSKFDKDLDL